MRKILGLCFCIALAGCGGSSPGSVVSGAPVTATTTSKRLNPNVIHEAQFAADPLLRADLTSQTVVDHLESSSGSQHDTGGAGVDLIPIRVARAGTWTFQLASDKLARMRVLDESGREVAAWTSGSNAVALPAGNFNLEFTSTMQADTILFIHRIVSRGTAQAAVSGQTVVITDTAGYGGGTIDETNTATTGFIGYHPTGPTNPTLVLGLSDFQTTFGSAVTPLSLAVQQFFANGGTVAYVFRVVPGSGGASTSDFSAVLSGPLIQDVNLLTFPDLAGLDPAIADSVNLQALGLASSQHQTLLIDLPASIQTASQALAWRDQHPQFSSQHCAVYWPGLIVEASDGSSQTIGASATMAGICATVDSQIGVWGSPAGPEYPLNHVLGLTVQISNTDAPGLADAGINLIESSGPGFFCATAKTLSSDATFRFLAPSRELNYIELSLTQGLQWAVFEPDGPTLWSAMTVDATDFLQNLWEQGGLVGGSPAAAFEVVCDATNNPANIRALGFIILDCEVSLTEPATFTLLRFQQANQ